VIVAIALAAFGVVFGIVYDVRHFFEHRAARGSPARPPDQRGSRA
jgi:hypothetical protein